MITNQDILIYISCHDDDSQKQAEELAESELIPGARIIRNKPSIFFENQIFDHMSVHRSEWQNKKYVGLVSYKYIEKTLGVKIDILNQINKDKNDTNLFYIAHCFFVKIKLNEMKLSTANASTLQHSAYFLLAWLRLGELLGIPEHVMMHEEIPFFAYNYWIADIKTMDDYLNIYKQVKDFMINDKKLSFYLNQNSLYDGKITKEKLIEISGNPYYTIHPFLLERLPGLIAVVQKLKVNCIGFGFKYGFGE